MKKKQLNNPNESAFLGIGTGKRVTAKAEAARLLEEEKRKTLLLQQAQAQAGFNPDAQKAEASLKLEQAKASALIAENTTDAKTSTTLYYIIGGIVAAALIALYFIKKR